MVNFSVLTIVNIPDNIEYQPALNQPLNFSKLLHPDNRNTNLERSPNKNRNGGIQNELWSFFLNCNFLAVTNSLDSGQWRKLIHFSQDLRSKYVSALCQPRRHGCEPVHLRSTNALTTFPKGCLVSWIIEVDQTMFSRCWKIKRSNPLQL